MLLRRIQQQQQRLVGLAAAADPRMTRIVRRMRTSFSSCAATLPRKGCLLPRYYHNSPTIHMAEQQQQQQQQASSQNNNETRRHKSTVAVLSHHSDDDDDDDSDDATTTTMDHAVRLEMQRLRHYRNVGVFAHVDAGKTTVTERMLALAGTVQRAGSVDDGNTVTDYLPAERERGITIQSAAIRFPWAWHNTPHGNDDPANDQVMIALIDTPGHVDFSVEVNRSVAVLDGAVLVVDAVAGVQAQTETVWRAMTQTMGSIVRDHFNSSILEEDEEWAAGLHFGDGQSTPFDHDYCHSHHGACLHEPLPCLAVINKMDKVGHNFGLAVKSLRNKLPGANPIPMQIPLFCNNSNNALQALSEHADPLRHLVALNPWQTGKTSRKSTSSSSTTSSFSTTTGEFVGVVDLVHMRAIIWPDVPSQSVASVEACAPRVVSLSLDRDCVVTQTAKQARADMMAALAEVDDVMEEYFLLEQEPTNAELRQALRRATLQHKALPVLAAAALRGKGIEPCLDAIADLLPSPLDRQPPSLTYWNNNDNNNRGGNVDKVASDFEIVQGDKEHVTLGHSLHPSALAFAFKVLHMKGRVFRA